MGEGATRGGVVEGVAKVNTTCGVHSVNRLDILLGRIQRPLDINVHTVAHVEGRGYRISRGSGTTVNFHLHIGCRSTILYCALVTSNHLCEWETAMQNTTEVASKSVQK
jgi:hypothetical protein